jgi:hypothetical protein
MNTIGELLEAAGLGFGVVYEGPASSCPVCELDHRAEAA